MKLSRWSGLILQIMQFHQVPSQLRLRCGISDLFLSLFLSKCSKRSLGLKQNKSTGLSKEWKGDNWYRATLIPDKLLFLYIIVSFEKMVLDQFRSCLHFTVDRDKITAVYQVLDNELSKAAQTKLQMWTNVLLEDCF